MRKLALCLTLLAAFTTGCSNVSTNTYQTAEAGVARKVVHGTIVSKRNVMINNSSDVGGTAGAVGGAVAGSAIGGSTRSNIVGAIGGAVVGGIVGQAIDKSVNCQNGIEYIIRLKKDDSLIAISQANDLKLCVGQKVLIIYGATTRVIPDETAVANKH
jgi:outer membrane lipoprotein SlyB